MEKSILRDAMQLLEKRVRNAYEREPFVMRLR